uniref:Xylanolytic transcriptional activator regulatory domain-containing protein n=1 Tax=Bionectria ochroleuca TaxID=29856 RepID=A0A8H7TQ38_BIOOC
MADATSSGRKWEPGLRSTLFESCVSGNDVAGLEFLLELARYWTSQKLPDNPVEEMVFYRDPTDKKEQDGIFTLSEAEFQTVLNQGNLELVNLVIRKIGAGLILDDLVRRSGENLEQKSEYYQGLTVYGKKRKDWSNIVPPGDRRRRRQRHLDLSKMDPHTADVGISPVIHAVRSGQIEILELLLSEAALQLYAEFARSDAAADNPKILHLLQSKAGFELTASEWLGASNHLILHHALLIPSLRRGEEVLKYLIQRYPDAVESRDSTGHTPLLIAARIGENILHLALQGPVESHRFCELTKLIDTRLLGDLFLQRKKLSANGTVPLHSWIAHICGYPSRDGDSDIFSEYGTYTPLRYRPADLVSLLQTLLEFSNDKVLESLNDVGDTCLHTAIKSRQFAIVRGLIQYNLGLVCRENAMGQTPLELANDLVIRATIKPPQPLMLSADYEDRFIMARSWRFETVPGLKARPPQTQHMPNISLEEKLAELGLSDDYSESVVSEALYLAGLRGNDRSETSSDLDAILAKKITLDFCKTSVQKNPGIPRILASVVAANDVARRVAELKSSSRGMGEEHTSMANAKLHQDIDAWNDWDGEDEYDENGNVDLTCTIVPHLRERSRSRGWRTSRSGQSDSQLWNVPSNGHRSLSSLPEDLYNIVELEDTEMKDDENLHIGQDDGLGFDLPHFIQPFPANISAGDLQYLQLKGVLALPPLAVQDAFIDAYIKHVQPRFHLISITDLYRMVNHRSEAGPEISLLLYDAVLYTAAAFVDLHFIQNAGYASRRVARKHLYDKTRLLYNIGYEKDHLVVVQSLLLLAGWYQTPSEHTDSWYWVGLAISTAQSIGLDKNQTDQIEPSIARTHLGRRVWWSCLMHDRLIALGLRYPSRLKEEDYDVDMLNETDFESDGLLASICIARAKLCVLIGEVLHEQYFILPCHDPSPDTTKRSILLSPRKKFHNFDSADLIYSDLCNWRRELPHSCHSNGHLKPAAGAEKMPVSLQGILLQMEFYTAVSALFRPYISQNFKNKTDLSIQDQISCRNRVRDAATKVTNLLTNLKQSDLYRYMPSTGVSITVSAAVVHLADVVGFPSFHHGNAVAYFQLCMVVLDRLREIYVEADYASNYLSNISKIATRSAYIG